MTENAVFDEVATLVEADPMGEIAVGEGGQVEADITTTVVNAVADIIMTTIKTMLKIKRIVMVRGSCGSKGCSH